ncbi:MAG: hypothetical protein K2P70_02450 [Hyphomonadaceae bacterium]|nr:hypothetical protein [Hyphomonadaceae bacterium]
MSGIKFKYWRAVGVAAALSVTACGGEGGAGGGEAGEGGEGGEAGEAGASAPAPSPATAAAPAGGEAGEAGAATAYAGLSGDQRTALRLQHLKGFVLAAARVTAAGQQAEAGVLVEQGLLEVFDVAAAEFGSLNVAIVRAAADGAPAHIEAAVAEIDRAAGALAEVDDAQTVARLLDISTGLYQHVIQADFVDTIEYQHSMGAALAAQSVLQAGQAELSAADADAYRAATQEMTRYVGLWPQAAAPETPTPYRDVLAGSSRVRLALYPYF